MHGKLTSTLALTLGAFLSFVGATSAVPVAIPPVPHLIATIAATVSPRKLPASEYAPVRWHLSGRFGTSDGKHLPALREVELDIDRDVKMNVKGYPVCKAGARERHNPGATMEACRAAVLGKGEAHVEIAFPEQKPLLVRSPLTVFNGGEKNGEVKLLIHIFITVPVPTAIVTDVKITRKGTGVHTVSKVPVIAGGSGSLIDFKFELGKTFSYKGKKIGYFEAKCPDGVFKANAKKLLFKNEARTPGESASTQLKGSLTVPCTSRD